MSLNNRINSNFVQIAVSDANADVWGINVSNVANIKIGGGNIGEVLTTDGTGNLNWAVGGSNINPVPIVEWVASSNAAGQTFTNTVLEAYQNTASYADVFINGVKSLVGNYTINGNTLTVTNWLNTGDEISVGASVTTGNVTITTATGNISNINLNGNAQTYLNGAGTWAAVNAAPGGNTTQIQYNNGGVFAGANMTFDNTLDSFTMGSNTVANGTRSLAIGAWTRATANRATAIGFYANASGEPSIAVGVGAMASGTDSAAFGRYARVTGTGSTAIGVGALVANNYTIVLGGEPGSYDNQPVEITCAVGSPLRFTAPVAQANTTATVQARLPILINGVQYYIMLTQ